MWSASSPNRQISYGVVPNEIGMMGFRDMFVLAPAATFHYGNNQHYQEPTLSFDTNIPLLSASPYIQNNGMDEGVINGNTHCREIHFQQPAETYNNNNIKKPMIGAINKPTSTSTCITCRDCGNQAKKGCSFKRCRTCCKSRGFDCSTHVKSTWVPAARRRERQLMGSGGGGGDVVVVGSAGSSQSINNSSSSKKPKVAVASQTTAASHASTSNTTPPTSFESGSSHQADHRDVDGKSFATAAAGDGSYNNNSKEPLPGQVRAPAVFKCVRVTAMDDGDDEYAYQATVKIGGHVFKGFLYDQGVADQVVSRDGIPSLSDLHLGGGGGGGRRDGGDESSSPAVQNMLHSSDVYGISGGHLLGGSSTSFIC